VTSIVVTNAINDGTDAQDFEKLSYHLGCTFVDVHGIHGSQNAASEA
jgi:hypothetical protein